MFVRFRQSPARLQVSLVETRRSAGKVHHEHIASLGSILREPTIADRVGFWSRLHARLGALGNRVTAEDQGKILGAIHARIAMVTADEQRALQRENAEADAGVWDNLQDMNAAMAEDLKGVATATSERIAAAETAAADAAANAAERNARIEMLDRGEAVSGGLGKPMTRKDFIKALGITECEARRWMDMAKLDDDAFEKFKKAAQSLRPFKATLYMLQRASISANRPVSLCPHRPRSPV
jgi:hypothetical protein